MQPQLPSSISFELGALMDVAMSLLGGGLQVGVDARQEGAFLL